MKQQQPVVLVALFALLFSSAAFAAGGEVKRTASGRPDLSGVYDISMLTPFQRSEELGDRLYLTKEEVDAMLQRNATARTQGAAQSDPERAAPEKGGNVGAYNDFWFEWGEHTFEIDGKYRTSILTEPANGRMPAMTPEAQARVADAPRFAWKNPGHAWWIEEGENPYDGPEDNVLGVRCLYQPMATVPMRPLPYNNLKTLVQTDDHVMIMIEWMHWTRVVRMDSEHLPADVRSLGGDSIGWWEDDTLVVETTNFFETPGVPKELKVTERFSAIDDSSLFYEFHAEDPDYDAPYGGSFVWPKTDAKSYEYACHEGNYAMGNTLRGARLLEKEYHEKQGSGGGE